MKQLGLMIDMDRCIGCKTCIVACRNHHRIVDHEQCLPGAIPYYIRVEKRTTGVFPLVTETCWVVPCQHCSTPGCLMACPRGAIAKDPETGVVLIDRERCDGCAFSLEVNAATKLLPAPCRSACPAGLNVQGYIQQIRQGRYEEAVRLILQRVPLPGVLGRICPHPCEGACRRGEVDHAVSIRELKRVAGDKVDFEKLPVPPIEENGGKVAVIGSGPAGLTVAYALRLLGYRVTIFEALEVLGGMLRVGIPAYRLPPEVLDREIAYLLRHGIEVRTGIRFGRDLSLQDLLLEGYGALFLGLGLHADITLDIPGETAQGVIHALRFLREVNLGVHRDIGQRVVVVGGGNVALDAARSARRLGCRDVTIVYRRSEEEMPAYPEEVLGARQEGIRFRFLAGPVEVLQKEGRVIGLKCLANELGPLDASGRRQPVPILESAFVVDCDTLIPAIGQGSEAGWTTGMGDLAMTGHGVYASSNAQTTIPCVFAAGDLVRGPSTVIDAIADGHRAAEAIHRFLQGLPLDTVERPGPEEPLTWSSVPAGTCTRAPRQEPERRDPGERAECFLEECLGLGEDQAKAEAERCLNCGACCMQSCPYDVIQFDLQAGRTHKCTLCYNDIVFGEKPICAEACMVDAIAFGEVTTLRDASSRSGREIDPRLSTESVLYLTPTPKNTLACCG